jgi:cellulose biosynthesis protein BcsQ
MKQLRDGFDTTKLGGSPARHLEMAYRHHLFLDLDPSSSTLLGRTHTQAFKENEEEKTTIRRNTLQGDMGEQDMFNFDQPDSHTIIL